MHVATRNTIVKRLPPASSRSESLPPSTAPPLPPNTAVQTKRLPRRETVEKKPSSRLVTALIPPKVPQSQLQRQIQPPQTPRNPLHRCSRSPSAQLAISRTPAGQDQLSIFGDHPRSRTASPVLDANEEELQLAKLRQLREERERKISRLVSAPRKHRYSATDIPSPQEAEVRRIESERKIIIAAAVKIKQEKMAAEAEVARLTERDQVRERQTKRLSQKALQV